MKTSLIHLDTNYGATDVPRATHPYRAEFRCPGEEPFVAYFSNLESVERFAKREYIYDVGVSVTFIVYNLGNL